MRIGAVSYLNSKPLVEGLAQACPEAELRLDFPSRLADDLAAGRLDVALIPSVESFANPAYEVVCDACVATQGPVWSVKLFSRVPPGQIRTLALDEGSRTSAALTRVMLSERYGVQPQLRTLPLGETAENCPADAVLLIGDRAMHEPHETFHTTWDLGAQWLEWTGLPFVFAMWVARRGSCPRHIAQILEQVRDRGLEQLEAIAHREAPALGLTPDAALRYFTRNLHFRMGSAERQGLALFRALAEKVGLVPERSTTPSDTTGRTRRWREILAV